MLCLCIRGNSRVEDAIECYQRAGNLFKMAKNWPQAGSAFCETANLHLRGGARHDAATNYVDAANCYKKSDINGKFPLEIFSGNSSCFIMIYVDTI